MRPFFISGLKFFKDCFIASAIAMTGEMFVITNEVKQSPVCCHCESHEIGVKKSFLAMTDISQD